MTPSYILETTIGDYKQKIIVCNSFSTITISVDDKIIFDGIATHIIDSYNEISFKDIGDKKHKYIKPMYNYATI